MLAKAGASQCANQAVKNRPIDANEMAVRPYPHPFRLGDSYDWPPLPFGLGDPHDLPPHPFGLNPSKPKHALPKTFGHARGRSVEATLLRKVRLHQAAQRVFAHCLARRHGPQVKVWRWAAAGGHAHKAGSLQGSDQHLLGKSTAVRHEQIAPRHGGAVAIQNIDGRNGAGRALVCGLRQFVLRYQLAHALQIGASDDHKAVCTDHSRELLQRQRHLVRVQVLDVVAGENCLHAGAGHRTHVGHGALHIGLHAGINIEAQLFPFGRIETGGSVRFVFGTAAHMQKGVHAAMVALERTYRTYLLACLPA